MNISVYTWACMIETFDIIIQEWTFMLENQLQRSPLGI